MKKLLLSMLIISLSGCATLFSGSTQTVNIKVIDSKNNELISDATCVVSEAEGGSHTLNSNPGKVIVARGKGALDIICKKQGYRQGETKAGDSFNAVTAINILFLPGFIVDAMSGAYKKFPSHFVVSMEKVNTEKNSGK